MRSLRYVPIIFVLALTPGLLAQSGAKDKKSATPPQAEGTEVDPFAKTGHLQIELHLRRGGAINGVALDGRLIERRGRTGEYEVLQETEKTRVDAGVRIWFYEGLPGFLFVAWRDIERLRIVRELNQGEFEVYEEKAQAAAEKARPSADKKTPNADTLSRRGQAVAGFGALEQHERDLLTEYPKSEGFTPERYSAIQKALVVEGKEPSEKDGDWLLVYPEWLEAWNTFHEAPTKPAGADRKTAPAPRPTASTKSPKPLKRLDDPKSDRGPVQAPKPKSPRSDSPKRTAKK
ncbi:MAG: hypothetical protein KDB53_10150 [Planctomycetes bacterium]|nr:hypothetical protein [Planctomycetota bacterium]